MKITQDTKFEINHFEGDQPDTTLWSFHSVTADGKWCVGVNGYTLLVSDDKEVAARFANEHTADEYITHIRALELEIVELQPL